MNRTIYSTLSLLLALCSNAIQAGPVRAIAPHNVEAEIVKLFQSEIIREAAETHPAIQEIISKLSSQHLFVADVTSTIPSSRLNHTTFFGVLSPRTRAYNDPILHDLHLLHELHHLATMPTEAKTEQEWAAAMIDNEKRASLFSESLVHFMVPGLRQELKIPEIWVDAFLNEEERLEPTQKNADFYKSHPNLFAKRLLERFKSIGSHAYSTLTDTSRRSWVYDRSNSAWTSIYWPVAQETVFKRRSLHSEKITPADFLKWIENNITDGVLFKDLADEFYRISRHLDEVLRSVGPNQLCRGCGEATARLTQLIIRGEVESTPSIPAARRLLNFGVSSTVYSVVFPETHALTKSTFGTSDIESMYNEAYTRKQDLTHQGFIQAYRDWVAPVAKGLSGYENSYPANGSSEAIKDSLALIKTRSPEIRLHVFKGEYEGVKAYAEAFDIELVVHERSRQTLEQLKTLAHEGEYFYVSQPSGIDGNVWSDFDLFVQKTGEAKMKVLVDLAYVGLVPRTYEINLNAPHIETVFFSLSKAFGVYYQRIGGVFSRTPIPTLYGNKWFKNLMSLKVGTKLLKTYGVYDLPRRYQWTQTLAIQEVNASLNARLRPSDVILLAHQPVGNGEPYPSRLSPLLRGSQKDGFIRACLSPSIDILTKGLTPDRCQSDLE